MISGEFMPTDGKILLYNQDVTRLPNNKRVHMGLARTYQITTLFQDFSVMENILLALTGTRKEKFIFFKNTKKYDALFEEANALLQWVNMSDQQDVLVKNLLIEHDIDLVFEVSDYIVVLQDGRVVASDVKDNIRHNKKVQQIYLGEEV